MNDRVDMSAGVMGVGGAASMPLTHTLARNDAERVNENIAAGRTVHFQRSAMKPWLRITKATPLGSMIKFEFADGTFRLCRCWLAAADAGEGYALGYNLRSERMV